MRRRLTPLTIELSGKTRTDSPRDPIDERSLANAGLLRTRSPAEVASRSAAKHGEEVIIRDSSHSLPSTNCAISIAMAARTRSSCARPYSQRCQRSIRVSPRRNSATRSAVRSSGSNRSCTAASRARRRQSWDRSDSAADRTQCARLSLRRYRLVSSTPCGRSSKACCCSRGLRIRN